MQEDSHRRNISRVLKVFSTMENPILEAKKISHNDNYFVFLKRNFSCYVPPTNLNATAQNDVTVDHKGEEKTKNTIKPQSMAFDFICDTAPEKKDNLNRENVAAKTNNESQIESYQSEEDDTCDRPQKRRKLGITEES